MESSLNFATDQLEKFHISLRVFIYLSVKIFEGNLCPSFTILNHCLIILHLTLQPNQNLIAFVTKPSLLENDATLDSATESNGHVL